MNIHKIMLVKKYIFLTITLLLASSILVYSFTHKNFKSQAQQHKKETWITVFVHGIMSIKPHLTINNFIRFVTDDIENTVYAKTVELMRNDPFFYKNQAMQDLGLIKINPSLTQRGNTSSCFAYLLEEMQNFIGQELVDNHYYTFGWSGLLSPTIRYRDAKDLFIKLEEMVARFHAQHIFPKVRVVGYSHGGNVALNLGAVHQREFPQSNLSIDELVLLGVPIQAETDYLINDPIFKRIYHIFSKKDRIQKLDFFSLERFFSGKRFRPRHGFRLPEKLKQIQLKVVRPTQKVRNNLKRKELSSSLKTSRLLSGRSPLLRDCSPGHCELWFFGWTPNHYRTEYPFYPLPTISILPFITYYVPQIEHSNPRRSIIFDIRPEHELILIKEKRSHKIHKIISFIPTEKLMALKQEVRAFQPFDYSPEAYNIHIKYALEKAQLLHEQENPPVTNRHAKRQKKVKKSKRKYLVPDTID